MKRDCVIGVAGKICGYTLAFVTMFVWAFICLMMVTILSKVISQDLVVVMLSAGAFCVGLAFPGAYATSDSKKEKAGLARLCLPVIGISDTAKRILLFNPITTIPAVLVFWALWIKNLLFAGVKKITGGHKTNTMSAW